MLRIETGRLSLRPIEVADAPEMALVLADPALYAFTGGAPQSEAELVTRYERWTRGPSDPTRTWWNLVVRERGVAIGYVQATVKPPRADIAWVIGAPWQGRGYATEAARALLDAVEQAHPVTAIRALIRPDHVASQRIAARLGLARTTEVVDGEDVWSRARAEE